MAIFRRPLEHPTRRPPILRLLALSLALLGGLAWWGMRGPGPRAPETRVLILGLPGMDHALTTRLLAEGKLPHLARLAEQGGVRPLTPTAPLTSASLWTSLTTGSEPHRHGIYDAVLSAQGGGYDPAPFSTWRIESHPEFLWDFIPTVGRSFESLPRGQAFWTAACEQRIPTTLLWMPGTFPADAHAHQFLNLISGRETPDALDSLGLPTLLSTAEEESEAEGEFFAGRTVRLGREGIWLRASLPGPLSPTVRQRLEAIDRQLERLVSERSGARSELRRKSLEARRARLVEHAHLELPVAFRRIGRRLEARLGSLETHLTLGEWSDPLALRLSVNGFLSLRAVCRMHVLSLEPETRIYVTALEHHATRGQAPVVHPRSFGKRLEKTVGHFATRGEPTEWAGLAWGRLPQSAFLAHAEKDLEQRMRAAEAALARPWGLFVCVLPVPEEVVRMFSRREDFSQAAAVERIYRNLDRWIGEILRRHVDERTVLLVLSPCGMMEVARAVDLNRWLAERGYLQLLGGAPPPVTLRAYFDRQNGLLLGDARADERFDWSKTEVFAAGAGSLFVNLAGRQEAGIVEPGAPFHALLARLRDDLEAMTDPATGAPIVARVRLLADLPENATALQRGRLPDIQVDFRPGYRAAWSSRLGEVEAAWIESDQGRWSGDYAGMDPQALPGVLFCNRSLPPEVRVIDVAPSVLRLLGVPVPEEMEGEAFLPARRAVETVESAAGRVTRGNGR